MSPALRPSRRGVWVNALLGAVVSFVLSFVPFSPALGGAVAGYLEGGNRNRGLRVGAYSGAIVAVPLVLLLGAAVVLGTFGVIVAPGQELPTAFGVLLVAALVLLVVGAYTVGLGAVGGYLGAVLAERRTSRPSDEEGEAFSTVDAGPAH